MALVREFLSAQTLEKLMELRHELQEREMRRLGMNHAEYDTWYSRTARRPFFNYAEKKTA